MDDKSKERCIEILKQHNEGLTTTGEMMNAIMVEAARDQNQLELLRVANLFYKYDKTIGEIGRYFAERIVKGAEEK